MSSRSRGIPWSAPLGVALAFTLAGCSPDAVAPSQQSLTQPEALAIGRETADEVESVASLFTYGDLLDVSGGSGFTAVVESPAVSPFGLCPSITPFPPADTDGDHVPDEVTLSFTLPDCRFTRRNGDVLEITGSIQITDPSTTDRGYRVAFTDFQKEFIAAGGAFHLWRVNGVRQILRSATAFSGIDHTTVDFESSERGSARLVKDWTVSFEADAGQTFSEERHLPSGNLTINGSTTRTRGDVTRQFSITTVTPLHFDASCNARPKFTSGELVITRTGVERSGTIRVVFTGCGQEPIITFEPGTA
ncbi:MAG: hypothetical protein ACREMF_08850 [Gemmatimonadales bacterium]